MGDLQLTADALWATDNNAGTLLRLDRVTGQILEEITIAPGDWYSSDLMTAAGWLWLTTREDPVVRQLNPSTGELVAEYQVDSQYTTHLIDQGDAVGIYGFSQLWRIEDGQAQAEQLIDDYGQEGLDPDAAVPVGGVVAFADEDVSVLAIRDSASVRKANNRLSLVVLSWVAPQAVLATRTLQGARRMTSVATDPSTRPLPCVRTEPTTMRSAPSRSASLQSALAGSEPSTSPVVSSNPSPRATRRVDMRCWASSRDV